MNDKNEMKHKFKLSRRFQYLVVARCIHCNLQRQKIGDKLYRYGEFDHQVDTDPGCTTPNQ